MARATSLRSVKQWIAERLRCTVGAGTGAAETGLALLVQSAGAAPCARLARSLLPVSTLHRPLVIARARIRHNGDCGCPRMYLLVVCLIWDPRVDS
jgi:hypothetical protein